VHVGNLQLPARRRFQRPRDIENLVVIKVESGDGQIRSGLRWLLFDRDRQALCIKLDNAVSLRMADSVGEYGGPALLRGGAAQQVVEPRTVKDIVSQNQRRMI